MGNCLKKEKTKKLTGLDAEIYFLQKQNLRCFDLLLAELRSLKPSFSDVDSQNLSHDKKIIKTMTYV